MCAATNVTAATSGIISMAINNTLLYLPEHYCRSVITAGTYCRYSGDDEEFNIKSVWINLY